MQTMSPLDASFLHIEDAVTHMHIGSVGIFEGPAPDRGEVSAAVARRLPQVPRYRQKVRFVPLALGRPTWVDDPHFNLEYHVRRTALPQPGGDEELRRLVGRVMSQPLDRDKPLWEMWVIEGLDSRWALISKTHHCMVDGVSATDLLSVILSAERTPDDDEPGRWNATPEPSAASLLAHSLAGRAVSPYEVLRTVTAAVRGPRRAVTQAAAMTKGLMNLRSLLSPTQAASTLNGPIGPHRRWAWSRAQLSDVKRIRKAHDATINDVVLAAITGGFRDLLLSRGEPVEGRIIRTLVPVSVRNKDETGVYDNKVSAMFAELPVGIEDPVGRLEALHEQMQDLKSSGQAMAAERLTALSGFAPAVLLAVAGRVGTRLPQGAVNTVTTNVPGPQQPLYLTGRRMLEAFPYVPLGGQVRIGIAIFSYDGGINFGVTGEYDTAADIDVLCAGIERAMAELLKTTPSPGARANGGNAPSSRGAKRARAEALGGPGSS